MNYFRQKEMSSFGKTNPTQSEEIRQASKSPSNSSVNSKLVEAIFLQVHFILAALRLLS